MKIIVEIQKLVYDETMEKKDSNMDTFIAGLEENYKKGIDLIKLKSKDYAGSDDPWKNFKSSEIIGIDYKKAILVRIMDKVSRASNLLDKEPMVNNEKIEDTLIDLINYGNILLEAIKNEKKNHFSRDPKS